MDETTRPHLDTIFRRLIAATGPISVAHYMAEANAHYYAHRDPLGSAGDFITAPEISQMFGEMIGLWLADLWTRAGKPDPCHYVELGPGRGTLAADALRAAARYGLSPTIHLVEGSEELRAMQRMRIAGAHWHDTLETVPQDAPMLLVANEFFDALPVRHIVATEQGWRERMVAHDGERFLPIAGERPLDTLVPEIFAQAPAGTIIETSPASAAIAFEIARRLKQQHGTALIIDYGYAEPRTGSSLQAVKDHEKVDPFSNPGETDLSALVNFGDLGRIAEAQEIDFSGPVGQGFWLRTLGIEHRAAALASSSPDAQADIASALHRLTDHAEMGDLFKVCAMTSPRWPQGEGFDVTI
ncbi:MAG: SAM-dependent methyltransferase [Blastomonas sp.]